MWAILMELIGGTITLMDRMTAGDGTRRVGAVILSIGVGNGGVQLGIVGWPLAGGRLISDWQ